MVAAIDSVPGYIELSTLVLVLVPGTYHADRVTPRPDGTTGPAETNYRTWRARGWCRAELMCASLAPGGAKDVLLVRSKAPEAPAATPSPAASPVKDAAPEDAPEDAAAAEPAEAEDAPAKGAAQDILAFMHYRYEIEEDCLMLYIYELQVAQNEATRRKGLGKHMLLLAEMIAKKSGMSGVMLTCQRANAAAQAFAWST